MKKFFNSILAGLSFFVLADQIVSADDLSNPAVFSTNSAYAATAGYALISKDGTNALDLLTQEAATARAAEAVNATQFVGRVAVLEASKITVTGQVAALQAVDIAVTGRVAAVEASTNGAILGLTAYQPNATNFLTEGYWDVKNTTQLVFIAGAKTNVIDSDITNP